MQKPERVRHITVHFPVLHMKNSHQDQVMKIIEEYNEFRAELFKQNSHERLMHELQDIFQAVSSLIYIEAITTSLDENEAEERVIAWFEEQNRQHRRKIDQYRAERGW